MVGRCTGRSSRANPEAACEVTRELFRRFCAAAPPAEKATACENQTGQTGTGDGAGDTSGDRRIVVSLKAAKIRETQDQASDGLPRTSMDVEIVCGLRKRLVAKE
jgi:hypothetical protein